MFGSFLGSILNPPKVEQIKVEDLPTNNTNYELIAVSVVGIAALLIVFYLITKK